MSIICVIQIYIFTQNYVYPLYYANLINKSLEHKIASADHITGIHPLRLEKLMNFVEYHVGSYLTTIRRQYICCTL